MTLGRWSLTEVDSTQFETLLTQAGCVLPIEQTRQWAQIDAPDTDRDPRGFHLVYDAGGSLRAGFYATRVKDHGSHFLWLRHGPVWVSEPSAQDESDLIALVRSHIASLCPRATHLRLDLHHEVDGTQLPSSLITYDRTVIIDIARDTELDGEAAAEEILTRFKARGRRDVRKSVRESGLECADETAQASQDFSEYHALMAQTAGRDGFVPWDESYYRHMVATLGEDHCRVYAGRIDSELVCWSIVTVFGTRATRYYAASATKMMRQRVTDRLVLFECVDLSRQGVESFDLMGIGSDLSPSLMGLNEFKTKFSKDVVQVAPTREVILRPAAFNTLRSARRLIRRLRTGKQTPAS
ncbi:lipid II:glycine glycyltransferase FemX [Schaalia vaccimaxillae]|uniref:lipid II:glycine glycyltransferase FemX n=1 Tax=Schaalia vaccimaxillae TaxID=183916 RepID=UPI0003B6BBB1|nr:GNAT family N-acetyltransferase [Schaalia vaccimaxillae]